MYIDRTKWYKEINLQECDGVEQSCSYILILKFVQSVSLVRGPKILSINAFKYAWM
jgi:hypothetical protein